MKKNFNLILIAAILGVVLFFLDTLLYFLLHSESITFGQSVFASGSISELYSRILMLTGLIIFAIIVKGKINELEFETKSTISQSGRIIHGHFDFNFLSSLSFQLRTPLNAIIGFSELLKKSDLTTDSKEVYLSHINSSSRYLLLLINNLSEISKIESNELGINRVETNVNSIIEELFQVFLARKKEMEKSNVQLMVEKINLSESFTILTDPERLKHVLNNLLENAFHQTEDGKVSLGYTKKDNGFIEFYVKDSGKGFSQQRLESIFERYNKLTDNRNLPFDGALLRMAISKSLVKLLGGDIRAVTKAGEGVTIYFTVPYMAVEKPEAKSIFKNAIFSNTKDWSNHKILIAEDVDSNFVYLRELLKPTNIKILWAKNGKEAVAMVNKNPDIELILMDILMPEMDGYEAATEIKKTRPDMHIIAQTAHAVEDGAYNENKKNLDAYLIKPIWAPQLLAVLEKYLV
jgi:two-component system sensor histidine kinase/response regulator